MPPASTPPSGVTLGRHRAGPGPAQPTTGGPPTAPPPPIPGGAATINSLSGFSKNMAQLFVASPKAFMNYKGVQTEAQAAQGSVVASTTAAAIKFVPPSAVDDPVAVGIDLIREGPVIRYIRFDQPNAFQGEKAMLRLFDAPGPGLLPVYWLPWQPRSIVETTIPAIPQGANVNDHNTYPKYFFTAALSGCSIFVKGPRDNPMIYHGGVNLEKIAGSSGKFWKEQMNALNTGFDAAQMKGLVHKKSYINGAERDAVQAYKRWIESGRTGTFRVDYVQGSGLVFGVREGRNWTFYLQENAMMNVIRFANAADLTRNLNAGPSVRAFEYTDSAGKKQSVSETVTKTPRKLGPVILPKMFDKTSRTYSYTAEVTESPVRVVEIYPASYKAATSSTLKYSIT